MGLFDKLRRARMEDPVQGTAQVVAAGSYHGQGIYSHCPMELVVQAEGLPPTAVAHTAVVHRKQWPNTGTTLPVTVDRSDPTRLTIEWDRVPDRYETARAASEQLAAMMRGEGAGGGATFAGSSVEIAGDTISRLERLQRLREQGVLTDAEFAEQKRRILADG